MLKIHPPATAAPPPVWQSRHSTFIAVLVLATVGAATGHVGAVPSEDAAGQGVSTPSEPGSGTTQSTRREPLAERVTVQVRRLDLARLTAAEFGDGEMLGFDNRDQLP